MSSIIEYIRYDIGEQTPVAFEQAYERAAELLVASPNCLSFELARCVEEQTRYVLRIEWDSIEGHMHGFRGSPQFREFLGHVRPYVESIEEMQHYEPTNVTSNATATDGDVPSLFEWAGGDRPLRRMIDAFYDEVEQLDLFRDVFPDGVSEHHRQHVTAWWSEVFGGPAAYTERHGGYDAMLDHHRDLGITAEQRASFVTVMSRAADTAGLPADPEFRSALLAYLEWGTRLAFENSQAGARPFEGAPVPRWGWGEAPPYQE